MGCSREVPLSRNTKVCFMIAQVDEILSIFVQRCCSIWKIIQYPSIKSWHFRFVQCRLSGVRVRFNYFRLAHFCMRVSVPYRIRTYVCTCLDVLPSGLRSNWSTVYVWKQLLIKVSESTKPPALFKPVCLYRLSEVISASVQCLLSFILSPALLLLNLLKVQCCCLVLLRACYYYPAFIGYYRWFSVNTLKGNWSQKLFF